MKQPIFASLFIVLSTAIASHAADGGAVKLTKADNHIAIEIAGQPLGDYYYAAEGDRPYARPFLWPVRASDGTIVTSDQSQAVAGPGEKVDHPHHRSFWIAQGDVNGADQWALHGADTPRQRHLGFPKIEGDTIIEDLAWEGKDHEPILNEQRTLRFFATSDGARGIDVTSIYTPIDKPVTFGDTKEAGLVAVRVAAAIAKTSVITLSTGVISTGIKQEPTVWGKKADWCDITGQIDGKTYGIAVFDHPLNLRHPSNWHVRHYGLMGANVFGLGAFDKKLPKDAGNFTMEKETPATFRYRVIIHTGDAKSAGLERKYAEFSAGKGG